MCLQKCTLGVYITGKQQQTKHLICLFQFLTGTVVAADIYMQVKYFMASTCYSVAYVIMGMLFRSFVILPPSFAETSETCLLLSSSKFYCGVVLMPWQFNVLGEGIFIYILHCKLDWVPVLHGYLWCIQQLCPLNCVPWHWISRIEQLSVDRWLTNPSVPSYMFVDPPQANATDLHWPWENISHCPTAVMECVCVHYSAPFNCKGMFLVTPEIRLPPVGVKKKKSASAVYGLCLPGSCGKPSHYITFAWGNCNWYCKYTSCISALGTPLPPAPPSHPLPHTAKLAVTG